MVLRAFFIFMRFPCIASATTAGASIASATHTIVQALNPSGIDNSHALYRRKLWRIMAAAALCHFRVFAFQPVALLGKSCANLVTLRTARDIMINSHALYRLS